MWRSLLFCSGVVVCAPALAADVVPTDVQLPGTQPGEVGSLESPDKCDNCHGGYDQGRRARTTTGAGSMMANAGRDPLFWANGRHRRAGLRRRR